MELSITKFAFSHYAFVDRRPQKYEAKYVAQKTTLDKYVENVSFEN